MARDPEIFKSYKELLNSLPNPVILASVEGKILALNDKAAIIFGKPQEELIGDLGYNLVESEAGERRRQVIHKIIHTKKPASLEDRERGRWWNTLFIPVADNNGEITKFTVVITDITELKKQKDELIEKQEEFLRRLIELSNDLFSIIDEKGIVRYHTSNFQKLTGYGNEETLGKSMLLNIHPDDKEKILNTFKKVLTHKGNFSVEYRFKHKNSSWLWFSSESNNLLDNPLVKGIVVTTRDITNRKLNEEAVKKSEKKFRNVVNSAYEIIFTINKDLKLTLWNKTVENITGFKSKKIIGKDIKNLDLFENSAEIIEFISNALKGKITYFNEIILKTDFGTKRIINFNPSYIKDEEGNISEILFVCRDVTKDKDIHDKLYFGNSYLIYDTDREESLNIFKNYLKIGNEGLFITRKSQDSLMEIFPKNVPQVLYLSSVIEKGVDSSIDLDKIYKNVMDFIKKRKSGVILFDRLDFLISQFSFTSLTQLLYKINDLIKENNFLLLLRVNPFLLSTEQKAVFEEEFNRFPDVKIIDIQLDEIFFNVLKYINEKCEINEIVNYSKIGQKFSISKVTVKKILTKLINQDLLYYKKRGRSKNVYITKKAEILLSKRTENESL